MRFLRGFGQFWYDFIIGDDWKIAAAVAVVVVLGLVAAAAGVSGTVLAPVGAVALIAAFSIALLIDVRDQEGSS